LCPFEGVNTGRSSRKRQAIAARKGSPTNIFIGRKNRAVTEHRTRHEMRLKMGIFSIVIRDKEDHPESMILLSARRKNQGCRL